MTIIFHKFLSRNVSQLLSIARDPRLAFQKNPQSPRLETLDPRSHWRNCCTSYKCISPAHSFHASASPREVSFVSPFLRVPGETFFFCEREVAEEKSFERIQVATRVTANVREFIHKTPPEKYDYSLKFTRLCRAFFRDVR